MALACDGPLTVRHGPSATPLRRGEMLLWESSGQLDAAPAAGEQAARVITWELPRHLLAVPDAAWPDLARRPVPAQGGPGALLARFLEGLAQQAEDMAVRSAEWLGSALVDLTAAFLTGLADTGAGTSMPGHQAALLRNMKRYIEDHLDDPDLSPGAISAAHHISQRYLHHIFQKDKRTVGGYVRELRLEHCRADLSDPRLTDRSVGEIRARWGFRDPAVFSRAFKKAYGIPPAEYRARRTHGHSPVP